MAKPPANKQRKSRSTSKTARKIEVASGIIQGTPITRIASEEGVSRSTVHRDAASPEVRQILTILISDKINRLGVLLEKILVVIEEALSANVLTPTKEGRVITVGPDHYARLAAAKRFIELTTAGRPLPKAPEPSTDKRTLTLAEFQEIVQQYQLSSSPTGS